MDVRSELVIRCAQRRRGKIGPLSELAFLELRRAVESDLMAFVDDPADQALLQLGEGLDAYRQDSMGDEALDDDEYLVRRNRRLARLGTACGRALATDPGCVDARVVAAIAGEPGPNELMGALLGIRKDVGPRLRCDGADAWDDVMARPSLRLEAAILRASIDTARFRMALAVGEGLMALSPTDPLGARLSCALTLARLEDEGGFDALDARFSRRGNAWSNLARAILLYKLGRLPAARRALRTFGDLSRGGSYALLRPAFVEPYLPDRPGFQPGGYEEANACVFEAEPIIADVPDFISWAQGQPDFEASAHSYAERHDLDW